MCTLPSMHSNIMLPAEFCVMLQTPAGAGLERWEMKRKIRKFTRQSHANGRNGTIESAFCPDWCKGHFENHGRRILETFDNQLRRIEGEAN